MYSPEHQPLTPNQVLTHTFFTLEDQAKTEGRVVKDFQNLFIHWASYWDFGTISSYFCCDGFIKEEAPEEGLVIALGNMRARKEIKTFETGLVVAKIFTGQRSKTAHIGEWEYSFYGSKEKSLVDVSKQHIQAILPGDNLTGGVKTAVLYVKDHRLTLNGYEIVQFMVEAPKHNEALRRGTGGFAGMFFTKDNLGREPKSDWELGNFIPLVDKPAKYDPRVVDCLMRRMEERINLSNPGEIEEKSEIWFKEDQQWLRLFDK